MEVELVVLIMDKLVVTLQEQLILVHFILLLMDHAHHQV